MTELPVNPQDCIDRLLASRHGQRLAGRDQARLWANLGTFSHLFATLRHLQAQGKNFSKVVLVDPHPSMMLDQCAWAPLYGEALGLPRLSFEIRGVSQSNAPVSCSRSYLGASFAAYPPARAKRVPATELWHLKVRGALIVVFGSDFLDAEDPHWRLLQLAEAATENTVVVVDTSAPQFFASAAALLAAGVPCDVVATQQAKWHDLKPLTLLWGIVRSQSVDPRTTNFTEVARALRAAAEHAGMLEAPFERVAGSPETIRAPTGLLYRVEDGQPLNAAGVAISAPRLDLASVSSKDFEAQALFTIEHHEALLAAACDPHARPTPADPQGAWRQALLNATGEPAPFPNEGIWVHLKASTAPDAALSAASTSPIRDERGRTWLMAAAANGNIPAAIALINAGYGQLPARDCYGWTALCYAMYREDREMAQLLIEHGDRFSCGIPDVDLEALWRSALSPREPEAPVIQEAAKPTPAATPLCPVFRTAQTLCTQSGQGTHLLAQMLGGLRACIFEITGLEWDGVDQATLANDRGRLIADIGPEDVAVSLDLCRGSAVLTRTEIHLASSDDEVELTLSHASAQPEASAAEEVVPSLIRSMCRGRRSTEPNPWMKPDVRAVHSAPRASQLLGDLAANEHSLTILLTGDRWSTRSFHAASWLPEFSLIDHLCQARGEAVARLRASVRGIRPHAVHVIFPGEKQIRHYADFDNGEAAARQMIVAAYREFAQSRQVHDVFATGRAAIRKSFVDARKAKADTDSARSLLDQIRTQAETMETVHAEQRAQLRDELDVAAESLVRAREEIERLNAINHHLRLALRSGQNGAVLSDQSADPTPDWPTSFDQLEDWCARYLGDEVVVTTKAVKAAKAAVFDTPEVAYQALDLLQRFYVPMRREGTREARERYLERLAELRFDLAPTGEACKMARYRDQYKVNWQGRQLSLDMHVQGNSTRGAACFRLYFAWDEESSRCIVGSFPEHLANTLSA